MIAKINNGFPLPIHTTEQKLPWQNFEDENKFENLCNRLVSKLHKIDSRRYLQKGNKQDGIDLYYIDNETDKYRTWQCKNYKKVKPSDLNKWVSEFLEGDFADKTTEFSLIISCTTEIKSLKEVKSSLRLLLKEKQITFKIYDAPALDKYLKDYPDIVYECFGNDWLFAFNGREKAEAFLERRPTLPERKLISAPNFYIPREVYNQEDYTGYYDNPENKTTLSFLIEMNSKVRQFKRILLLSAAGLGKSTEIEQTAYKFSLREEWLVCKISLSNYLNSPISELFDNEYPNWKNWPGETLFLIDGLDEVKAQDFQDTCKQINVFSLSNPRSNLVVTSRTNFIHKANPLDGFDSYYLQSLTYSDTIDFIRASLPDKNPLVFRSLLEKVGLDELSRSPFYLHNAIEIYKAYGKNKFPSTKSKMFETIINYRIDEDLKKFSKSIDIDKFESEIWKMLEKIALVMALSSISSISKEDIQKVLTKEEINACKHILLIKSSEKSDWRFEHKNFQEYITARVLARKSLNDILKLISFSTDSNKIKPKWVNTTSFIIGLSDKSNQNGETLISWLLEHNKDVLVRFEKDKIDADSKFEIVRQIYLEHKEKNIFIWSEHYTYPELGEFVGYNKKMIDFLLKELKLPLTNNTLESALSLLKSIEANLFGYEEEIVKLLLNSIYSKETGIYVKKAAIDCLRKHSLGSERTIDKIINKCPDLEKKEVRNAVYHLALETGNFEKYVDRFIKDGFQIISKHNNEVRSVDSEYYFFQLFLQSKKASTIIFIFKHLIKHKNYFADEVAHDFYGFEEKFLCPLLKNAEQAYPHDPIKIFNIIFETFLTYGDEYQFTKLKIQFSDFFTNTGTALKAFNKLWKDKRDRIGKRNKAFYLGVAIDEKVIIKVARMILTNKYSDSEIYDIFYGLSYANKSLLYKNLMDKTEAVVKRLFNKEEKQNDYSEKRKKKETRAQELLVDKEAFKQSVEQVFQLLKKDTVNKDDLHSIRKNKELDEEFDNTIAIRTIRQCKEGQIALKDLEPLFSNAERWEWFVIANIFNKAINKIAINEDLKLYAIHWTQKNLRGADFKGTIKFKPDGKINYHKKEQVIIQFVRSFEVDIQDEKLMEMIWYDLSGVYPSYPEDEEDATIHKYIIRKVKNIDGFKDYLIANLKAGIKSKRPFLTHLYVCSHLNESRALKFFYRALDSSTIDALSKIRIYKMYVELGGEREAIKDIYLNYEPFDYWSSHLTSEYAENGDYSIKDKLLSWFNATFEKEKDRVEVALYLILCGEIKGLKYIFQNTEFLTQSHYTSKSYFTFKNLSFSQALPLFIPILSIRYSNTFGISSFSAIDTFTKQFIMEMGLSSESNYSLLVNTIQDYIKKHESKFPKVVNLWYELDRLETQYYQSKEDFMNLDEAIKLSNNLLQ